MVTSTGTFVSCKDYDDDIDNLDVYKRQVLFHATKIVFLTNSPKFSN